MVGLLTCATKHMLDTSDVSSRTQPIKEIVLHCTGGSLVDKAIKACIATKPTVVQLNAACMKPEISGKLAEYAGRYYSAVNKVSTGAVLGYCGEIIQTADMTKRAWSAGISDTAIALYKRGIAEWSRWQRQSDGSYHRNAPAGFYDFWRQEYEAITGRAPSDTASPLEFTGGNHGPDHIAFSVDLLTPPYQHRESLPYSGPALDVYPTGALYTFKQHHALRAVIREVAEKNAFFKPSRETVLAHSFTSPLERVLSVSQDGSKVGYGFDPGPLNWELLL